MQRAVSLGKTLMLRKIEGKRRRGRQRVRWLDSILWHPLLLLPSIFLSIRFFPRELALRIRWPKYWSFSIGISLSNEYSGLISYRIDWFDLLAVQGTIKSLLQHHNLKISVLQHSTYFMVQLSHLYMTTGKTTALTRWSVSGEGDMWPFTFRQ